MLEVMNAGLTDLSRPGNDNALVLNCWEKSSPLIQELERTVNFAERKCGDLMQQLNFYKEYYEKWMQNEKVNNLFNKKKIKNSYKEFQFTKNSSENDFEKVNQYFYKKIKSKITEMNNEISRANKKLSIKIDSAKEAGKNSVKDETLFLEDRLKEINEAKNFEKKSCKSEPLVLAEEKKESQPSFCNNQKSQENIKIAKKESSKSMPVRNKETKKKNCILLKKRFSNLQRYKLRSKSLPQGVRRKFGFGGFIEVFDPKGCRLDNTASKSRTSLRIESSTSLKSRVGKKQSKTKQTDSKKDFSCKRKKSSSGCDKDSEVQDSKSKTKNKNEQRKDDDYFSKSTKSEAMVSRSFEKIASRRNAVSQSNIHRQPQDINMCQDIIPSENLTKVSPSQNKYNFNLSDNLSHLISKPNSMIPFFRNPIPFIPCSSTSKTFNLGLNVQQVLSLIKHKRHSITLQTVIKNGMRATRSITDKIEPTVNTLFFSQTTTSHSHVTSTLCPARTCSKDTFSIVTGDLDCRSKCTILKQAQALRSELPNDKNSEKCELQFKQEESTPYHKLERPEDVWVVEQPDDVSTQKKSRLRCTCFPSKHCEDYHKILKEYTDWRICPTKTNNFTAGAYSSYQPLIYEKSEFYPNKFQNKPEITTGSDGRFELNKVHNDLINLNRKYSNLQQKLEQKEVDDLKANAELDAMESELASTEMEIKNILNFYQQLILLKEKLKSLRVKSGHLPNHSPIQNLQNPRPRKDPLRPTPSMALTKLLRKIQNLQDTIKLIDTP